MSLKILKNFWVGAVSSILITGCAGLESTYKPYDFSGGYGEEKINANTYVVFFDANGFTPAEVSQKYFLRRARQITLKNDFNCFVVLEKRKTLNANYMTSNKLVVNTKYYSANENAYGEAANKLDENSLSGIIQMYKQGTDSPPNCLSAITGEE